MRLFVQHVPLERAGGASSRCRLRPSVRSQTGGLGLAQFREPIAQSCRLIAIQSRDPGVAGRGGGVKPYGRQLERPFDGSRRHVHVLHPPIRDYGKSMNKDAPRDHEVLLALLIGPASKSISNEPEGGQNAPEGPAGGNYPDCGTDQSAYDAQDRSYKQSSDTDLEASDSPQEGRRGQPSGIRTITRRATDHRSTLCFRYHDRRHGFRTPLDCVDDLQVRRTKKKHKDAIFRHSSMGCHPCDTLSAACSTS